MESSNNKLAEKMEDGEHQTLQLMSALKEEFKLKYLPESKGNYIHAMKQQLNDYDQIVSQQTLIKYEGRRKEFMKTIRKNCRVSHQDIKQKEMFIDNTIEEDLRFFKANYS